MLSSERANWWTLTRSSTGPVEQSRSGAAVIQACSRGVRGHAPPGKFYRNKCSESHYTEGRIQDWKKEGGAGVQGLVPKIFSANSGDFLKNLAQKKVGVRPPPLDLRLILHFNWKMVRRVRTAYAGPVVQKNNNKLLFFAGVDAPLRQRH